MPEFRAKMHQIQFRQPTGELTALSRPFSWWVGADCPSLRTPPPLSALRVSNWYNFLRRPHHLSPPKPKSQTLPVCPMTPRNWYPHFWRYAPESNSFENGCMRVLMMVATDFNALQLRLFQEPPWQVLEERWIWTLKARLLKSITTQVQVQVDKVPQHKIPADQVSPGSVTGYRIPIRTQL